MMKKRLVFFIVGALIFLIFILRFSLSDSVEITQEYVSCSKWGKNGSSYNYPSVKIRKIHLNNSLSELNEIVVGDIIHNYKVDSSFCYNGFTNNTELGKVYFNKVNDGFIWRKECYKDLSVTQIQIGLLEFESWYRISNLLQDDVYFVYIDKNGSSHIYSNNKRIWLPVPN